MPAFLQKGLKGITGKRGTHFAKRGGGLSIVAGWPAPSRDTV
jgi:hypothetical protein